MKMNDAKIVMLAGEGISTNILYHALKDEFAIHSIILEAPVSKTTLIKKRIKKLGLWKVTGQILFQAIIAKFLHLTSSKRKKEILATYSLDASPLPAEKITHVSSVNDEQCLELLQRIAPQIVIVNGTRIISEKILNSINATFINMHAGITPRYRGVHGAYWALANNDRENCGVTVHMVDAGIDTGEVIFQTTITPTKSDNFATYPLLQLAAGIPGMKKAIADILNRTLVKTQAGGESALWSHPGFGQYLYKRLTKKVK